MKYALESEQFSRAFRFNLILGLALLAIGTVIAIAIIVLSAITVKSGLILY